MRSPNKVDLGALLSALDTRRQQEDVTWHRLARQLGLSPSTLTRLQQGKQPDINTFAALVLWLEIPAEHFFGEGQAKKLPVLQPVSPHLREALGPVLKEKDLSLKAARALGELVQTAYRAFKMLDAGGTKKRRAR